MALRKSVGIAEVVAADASPLHYTSGAVLAPVVTVEDAELVRERLAVGVFVLVKETVTEGALGAEAVIVVVKTILQGEYRLYAYAVDVS